MDCVLCCLWQRPMAAAYGLFAEAELAVFELELSDDAGFMSPSQRSALSTVTLKVPCQRPSSSTFSMVTSLLTDTSPDFLEK